MTFTRDLGLRLMDDEARSRAASTDRERAEVEALVQRHAAVVFRVAHSVLRSRTDAEDVVQDTFVRVLQHSHRLHEVRDVRVWLVRIAWNLALDRKRRIRPEQMDAVFAEGLRSSAVPADRHLAASQQVQRVLGEMERLPRREREALLLSTVEELGTPELAAVLGTSEGSVRALLSRARVRLRERLREDAQGKGGRR